MPHLIRVEKYEILLIIYQKKNILHFLIKELNFNQEENLIYFVKNFNFRNLCDDNKKLLLYYKYLYDVRLKNIQKEEKQI